MRLRIESKRGIEREHSLALPTRVAMPFRIVLHHGYKLTGSGSNEYVRYISHALHRIGHDVHVLCTDPRPENVDHAAYILRYDAQGDVTESVVLRKTPGITVHVLPRASIYPVFLNDKQREGNVKTFLDLTEEERQEYHALNVRVVGRILHTLQPDIVIAQHVVYQPIVLKDATQATKTPYVIFPHGSALEYTVRLDESGRYRRLVRDGILGSKGVISGNDEVLGRLLSMYERDANWIRTHAQIVGVGVETSLFYAVSRGDRCAAVKRFSSEGALTARGKTRTLSQQLYDRLDGGDLEAVHAFRDAYVQNEPDADVIDQLETIPWDTGSILMFVGSLTVGKGVQNLLCAMPSIVQRHSNTHLVVVGGGTYREVLEALVHGLATGNEELLTFLIQNGWSLDKSDVKGPWEEVAAYYATSEGRTMMLGGCPDLKHHVHFTGFLSHSRLRHILPCADLAVFPSVIPEAYALVLYESLACGVLPVVPDFSGFRSGVADLSTHLGQSLADRLKLPWHVQKRVEGIRDTLTGLLADQSIRDMSSSLRAIAVENYDWNVRAKQMVDALKWFLET